MRAILPRGYGKKNGKCFIGAWVTKRSCGFCLVLLVTLRSLHVNMITGSGMFPFLAHMFSLKCSFPLCCLPSSCFGAQRPLLWGHLLHGIGTGITWCRQKSRVVATAKAWTDEKVYIPLGSFKRSCVLMQSLGICAHCRRTHASHSSVSLPRMWDTISFPKSRDPLISNVSYGRM